MIRNSRSIFIVFFLFSISLLNSCITETGWNEDRNDEQGIGGNNNDRNVSLVLNVRPIEMSDDGIGNEKEKITSLRIIMLNDGAIEANRYIEFTPREVKNFTYTTYFWTENGTKDFYVIANEKSFGEVQINDTKIDFHEFLSSYDVNNDEKFADYMNNAYFSPNYNAEGGNYLLPYISHYDGITIEENDTLKTMDMILVPAATKFIFRFLNYRPNLVEVTNITVYNLNSDNYVLPHVEGEDLFKEYQGKKYPWIDWLDKVSQASHSNSGFEENKGFNDSVGWISYYELPNDDKYPYQFVGNNNEVAGQVDREENVVIPITKKDQSDNPIPNTIGTIGPFYCPEAFNPFPNSAAETRDVENEEDNKEEKTPVQAYYLTINLKDSKTGTSPTFEKVHIDNLGALFRNTCVIITLSMSEGQIEAYAEIVPWTWKGVNGWVIEGQEPEENPFKSSTQ